MRIAPALEGGSNARDGALQIARLARPAYGNPGVSASSCHDRFVVPVVNHEQPQLSGSCLEIPPGTPSTSFEICCER